MLLYCKCLMQITFLNSCYLTSSDSTKICACSSSTHTINWRCWWNLTQKTIKCFTSCTSHKKAVISPGFECTWYHITSFLKKQVMKTQLFIRGHLLKNSFISEVDFLSSKKLLIYKHLVLADYFCDVCTMTSKPPKFSNTPKQRTYINIFKEKTTLQKDPIGKRKTNLC